MFNFIRIARHLEQAAKCASEFRDEKLVASYLGKAEALGQKSRLNWNEVRAVISLYDRVILAAADLNGTIPIREHCEELKSKYQSYMALNWPE